MTTAQVVEMSVTVNNNSPIQDYVHPDDQTQPTFDKFILRNFAEERLLKLFSGYCRANRAKKAQKDAVYKLSAGLPFFPDANYSGTSL